jgi:hypothetical protein
MLIALAMYPEGGSAVERNLLRGWQRRRLQHGSDLPARWYRALYRLPDHCARWVQPMQRCHGV